MYNRLKGHKEFQWTHYDGRNRDKHMINIIRSSLYDILLFFTPSDTVLPNPDIGMYMLVVVTPLQTS